VTGPMDFAGRRILLTGASSGIGRETAVLLSQLGAELVLAGRSLERLQQTAEELSGCGHRLEVFDLADVQTIPAWLKTLSLQAGAFDGIVHSAGVHSTKPLRVLDAVSFEAVYRINVTAALMLAKGFRQKGCSTPGGGIVFLSSVAGLVGQPGVAAYAASKAAVLGLTRSLALELAREGIRVNSVAPGMVKTEMTERIFSSLTPEQIASIESAHPLGLGQPRDVANAIAFLLSEAARWITGSTLVVDGGYTAQ
jgi:NAD(P)-dependent dehydrogenase (short-subunit alcohol dehydrogenase family)